MSEYTPPQNDKSLELNALLRTGEIVRKGGITHPDDVRAIHAAVLRHLVARKTRAAAPKNQVFEALGMGANQ